MAEYIDRTELEPDTEWSEYYDDFISYSQSQINSLPQADVIERSKIDKAKSNIEIMLEQEKQKDGTYTDVGKGIAIALGLLNNELGEDKENE